MVALMLSYFISLTQHIRGEKLNWRKVAVLPGESATVESLGYAGVIAGIEKDYLIVSGGANFPKELPWKGGEKKFYRSSFVFKILKSGLKFLGRYDNLSIPIAYAASCNTRHGVFFAGGENEKGPSAMAGLIRLNHIGAAPEIVPLPALPMPLSNAMAVCKGDQVFLAGGENTDSTLSGFYTLDLNHIEKGWIELPPLPKPVSHFVFLSINVAGSEQLFLIGGRTKIKNAPTLFYRDVFSYNLRLKQWEIKAPLPYPLAAGTGATFNDHTLLVMGGDKGIRYNQVEKVLLEIKNEKDSEKIQQLNEHRIQLQETHPGFSKEMLAYDWTADKWLSSGDFPFDMPVTTRLVQRKDRFFLVSGEIRAGIRTPNIYSGLSTTSH